MKAYVVSLALGLLVGTIYALFQVRSPAPPIIALVGLAGILLGEQIPPLVRQLFQETTNVSFLTDQLRPHVFGQLPKGRHTLPANEESAVDRSRGGAA